jgi:hypothetical protein
MLSISGRIDELLSNHALYGNVPLLKRAEIRFFLDHMNSVIESVKKPAATPDANGISEKAFQLSCYADAFFTVAIGFFDSLAILHTKIELTEEIS